MARDWSTIPLDILVTISMKLETCEDFIYFSLVCRWWNIVASSIKNDWRAIPMPWLLLAENNKENPRCLRKIINIKTKKCYELALPETFETRCSGSAYGWVTMIDRHLSVILFNPISKARILFPSLENIPTLEGHAPHLVNKRDEYNAWCAKVFVKKVVLLKASHSCRNEFAIVVFCITECAAVACPGDQSWTLIVENEWMVDIVVVDDRVFALYHDGRLAYWNAKEFFNLEFVKRIDYLPSQGLGEGFDYNLNKIYLVVQSDSDFIMVLRYKNNEVDETGEDYDYDVVYRTCYFQVFKINPIEKIWEELEELCGAALLVGCNSSMLVSSGKYLHESSIYFTDDEHQLWGLPKEFGGHDMGVFDIKTDEIIFYEGDDTRSSICPPTLFIPQL